MPNDRTTVTELATALGTLNYATPEAAVSARPAEVRIADETWARLAALLEANAFEPEFEAAFSNGQAFNRARDALRRRPPRLIEWTGGRRPIGDEVAPIDIRIDHVFLVSCKYLSANIANPSPARLFDGLLATSGAWDRTNWYEVNAPREYEALYRASRACTRLSHLPLHVAQLTPQQKQSLRRALPGRRFPEGARDAYARLCEVVSLRSARRWAAAIEAAAGAELLFLRLLRIGNAPYFLLGADSQKSLRLRVASIWDWRQAFRFIDFEIAPASVGQPQVAWRAEYENRESARRGVVEGRVEIRWSHGRFAQPPEAKVYLETATSDLPGYMPLE